MKAVAEPAVQRATILRLTKLQTWCGAIVGVIGVGTTIAAIAHGWVGLPAKVEEIRTQQETIVHRQAAFEVMTNRVQSVEDSTKLIWNKLSSDHDLLTKIDQKLSDIDEQQKETAQDVKALRK